LSHPESLSLEIFVKTGSLYHSDKFAGLDVLDLLGKKLEAWLDRLLSELGVTDQPIIKGKVHPQAIIEGRVYVAEGAEVEPTAYIKGPCYIGPDAEVRHGAYIRGVVYVGREAVVGHTTEVKGSVFLDQAKAGHFAYIGDSILGIDCNLGAGTKLANLKLNHSKVRVSHPKTRQLIQTDLKKFGAVIGDGSQIGCNAVLSPGSLLKPGSLILPCAHHVGTTHLAT
jgi:NDP-sugar pyrophosphorylase family protein